MILGLGSDLCNIERIQSSLDRFGTRFEQRAFTELEMSPRRRPARTIMPRRWPSASPQRKPSPRQSEPASRQGVFMKDIGVVNAPSGAPTLALTGGAKARLDAITPDGHVAKVHLTLTDDHPWAFAMVMIEAIVGRKVMMAADELALVDAARGSGGCPRPAHRLVGGGTRHILAGARRARLPQPDRQAVLHPSESMMPGLLVGDRLVVTKYPYGYSFVTPTFHLLPFMPGRLFGSLPERGDVVIVTPPGTKTDYIKRVIGLPGDTIAVRDGVGLSERQGDTAPGDGRSRRAGGCQHPLRRGSLSRPARHARRQGNIAACRSSARRCPMAAPTTRSISAGAPATISPRSACRRASVFLMGDNRDNSRRQPLPAIQNGLGGPVPWENIGGRAEFITFSLDGSASWNPLSWPQSSARAAPAPRSIRNGTPVMSDPLASDEGIQVVQEPGPNELRDPIVRAELKRASVWFGLAIAVALVVLLIQPLLIIFGGLVFASMLDGGARLLGRMLPIPRTLRIVIVVLLVIGFFGGIFYLTGVQIAASRPSSCAHTLEVQANEASSPGSPTRVDARPRGSHRAGAAGARIDRRLTSAVGSAIGAVASLLMIVIDRAVRRARAAHL
jgi:signal peptidase I